MSNKTQKQLKMINQHEISSTFLDKASFSSNQMIQSMSKSEKPSLVRFSNKNFSAWSELSKKLHSKK